jgi:hypothetical protein
MRGLYLLSFRDHDDFHLFVIACVIQVFDTGRVDDSEQPFITQTSSHSCMLTSNARTPGTLHQAVHISHLKKKKVGASIRLSRV